MDDVIIFIILSSYMFAMYFPLIYDTLRILLDPSKVSLCLNFHQKNSLRAFVLTLHSYIDSINEKNKEIQRKILEYVADQIQGL